MSFLSRIFGHTKKMIDATITQIGPSQSGKTHLVRFLETGQRVSDDISTTLGIEIRKEAVSIDNGCFSAIDTGGQKIYQQTFWEIAIQQTDAAIFVTDAPIRKENNPNMYEIAQEKFSYALDIIPSDVPLLILLNKQDLPDKNPMSPQEAFTIFNQALFAGRTVAYLPTSAKFGIEVN